MIIKMNSRVFYVLLCGAVFLLSCSEKAAGNLGSLESVLIQRIGTYASTSGDRKLVVSKDARERINYELLDANGDPLLKGERPFSPFHEWGIYLDSTGALWVHSSDVGTFVWKQSGQGDYVPKIVGRDDLPHMPAQIKNLMPRSLLAQWAREKSE